MFQVPGRRAGSLRIGLYTNFLDTTDRAVLAEADGSASQLWRVSTCEGGHAIVPASGMTLDDFAQSTSEGNRV